ncbi:hypothetical protein [Campylobacter sp. LR291e]|nr:hypothetical protein [Campylobacter sp. LR291e]
MYLASIDGFSTNLLHINSGVMTANAGDSAQFLFFGKGDFGWIQCLKCRC